MKYLEKEWPTENCSFVEIRTDYYHYVDKTALMWQLANQRKRLFFLGRPRRFGKSLLTNTLRAYFEGQQELFKGLAAEQLEAQKGEESWQVFPVLHFDMFRPHDTPKSLSERLVRNLINYEKTYGIKPLAKNNSPAIHLDYLLEELAWKGLKPVVLIDEYDAPLVHSLGPDRASKAMHDRFGELLRVFYSNLKSSYDRIRFAMLTGVSQFQQVSVFSGLNNITDITLDPQYATICGITKKELVDNFHWRVEELATANRISVDETYGRLERHYDGFRFTLAEESVYNPFSIIRCLDSLIIKDYWYHTGTPYVLRVLLPGTWYNITQFERGVSALPDTLLSFDPTSLNPVPILFQAGYLTIKDYSPDTGEYHLQFPNVEVRNAFYNGNKTLILGDEQPAFGDTALELAKQINSGNVPALMRSLRYLLAKIPYNAKVANNPIPEVHFQVALFYVLRLTGKEAQMEVGSDAGRSDIELYTKRFIYIFELKINSSPQVALQQIIDHDYALQHADSGRQIIGIGINFNSSSRKFTWIAKHKGGEVFTPEEEPSL